MFSDRARPAITYVFRARCRLIVRSSASSNGEHLRYVYVITSKAECVSKMIVVSVIGKVQAPNRHIHITYSFRILQILIVTGSDSLQETAGMLNMTTLLYISRNAYVPCDKKTY